MNNEFYENIKEFYTNDKKIHKSPTKQLINKKQESIHKLDMSKINKQLTPQNEQSQETLDINIKSLSSKYDQAVMQ